MKEYLKSLRTTHRATRQALINQGKSYRSRFVAFENGYLTALQDILDAIELPEKNRQLEEVFSKLGESLSKVK